MQLIGMFDSPYVRRVAVSMAVLGLKFEHQPLSVFRHFDAFAQLNPVVKAPTLIEDDGTVLVDSTLILDHLDHKVAPEKRLMPGDAAARTRALHFIGFALAAMEKTVQIVYERQLRPEEKQHEPWLKRVMGQFAAAYDVLERDVERSAEGVWLTGERMMQPDISVAVAWQFTQYVLPGSLDTARYPALAAFSQRAEALPAFMGVPLE
jgi:glutathione S-transferase